jgi:hypothetical protein
MMIFISNSSEKALVSENSRLTNDGFFYHAEMIADKLLTIQPESPNYNYRKGYLVMAVRKDYTSAIPYFLKAIVSVKPHYDAFNTKETSAPADAFYYLGTCYHLKGDIENAISNYNSFIANTYSKSELIQQAEVKLIQCELAKKLMARPIDVTLTNMGPSVNSIYPDYSGVISLDGSAIYFTSKRPWEKGETEKYRDPATNQYPEDVYVSYLNPDKSWTPALRLEFSAPSRNEATIGVSSDERRIYLYQDTTGNGDIYYSDFYSQRFNEIEILTIKGINTEYWESHCMVTSDGSQIYFTSDREGGYGGRDIYVCSKINDTTWTEPKNLGPHVNGPNDEDAPFVSKDHKNLYFASNGVKSIGGFDILVCAAINDSTWSEGKNLGYPLNSTNDDIYYSTTIDGLKGYMTSNRPNGLGEKDIYEISNEFLGVKSIAILKGLIRTKDNSPLPEDWAITMVLKCKDCADNEESRSIFPRLKDGVFVADLQPCKTYVLTYENASDEINMYREEFKTDCSISYQEIYKEVLLDPVIRSISPIMNYSIDGYIADRKSASKIPEAKVELIDPASNMVIETTYTDTKGFFKFSTLQNKHFGDQIQYQVKISKTDYLTQTFEIKETLGNESVIHLLYSLEKTEIGSDIAASFGIKTIYFDYDKATIRKDAKIELDKIVKILNDNPTTRIVQVLSNITLLFQIKEQKQVPNTLNQEFLIPSEFMAKVMVNHSL